MLVKLIKGLAYADGVVFVNAKNPIVEVDEDEGQRLLESGHFEEIEQAEPIEEKKEYIVAPVDFDKMKLSELKEYAKENEIDISGLNTKAEIKQALISAINSRVPDIFVK